MSELELMAQRFKIAGKMKKVHFALEKDLWLNATEVAKLHNKRLDNYWISNETIEYINALGKTKQELTMAEQGRYGGTLIHKDLHSHFLYWAQRRPSYIIHSEGIYIITDGEYCKIGIATDIEQRVKQLQTGNARKLEVLHYEKVRNAKKIESKLHKKMKHKRLSGEWFDIDDDGIDYIRDYIKKHF